MEVLTLIPNRYGFAPGQRGSIELWEKVLARKGAPSLLHNNINHPNDFGHWIYFQVLRQIGL